MNSVSAKSKVTFDEIHLQAKLAWKNANRCIGRAHWNSLEAIDARGLWKSNDIIEALFYHITYATNNGAIRSVITIFDEEESVGKGPRILNHQLLRYAGYQRSDGSVLGDPQSVAFTNLMIDLGWTPPSNPSPFDILPIAIQWPGQTIHWREIPKEIVLEVPIKHPDFGWFERLGLKWYATPIISDMLFRTEDATYKCGSF